MWGVMLTLHMTHHVLLMSEKKIEDITCLPMYYNTVIVLNKLGEFNKFNTMNARFYSTYDKKLCNAFVHNFQNKTSRFSH